MEAEALRARQREQHRPPGHVGQQRGVALDVQVLLGAERAAVRDLGHADLRPRAARGTRRSGAGPPTPPGPARTRGSRRPSRHGERRLRLEERVLDRPGSGTSRVSTWADAGQRRVDVASLHDRGRQQVAAARAAAALRRRARATGPSPARAPRTRPRPARRPRALRGESPPPRPPARRRRSAVTSPSATSWRQSRGDQALGPLARHVGRGRDRDDAGMRLRLGHVDAQHPRPGVVGEPDGPVQHPRPCMSFDVRLVAEGQLAALVPAGARAPAPSPLRSGSGTGSPRRLPRRTGRSRRSIFT